MYTTEAGRFGVYMSTKTDYYFHIYGLCPLHRHHRGNGQCAIYSEDFIVYCWYTRNVIAGISKRV